MQGRGTRANGPDCISSARLSAPITSAACCAPRSCARPSASTAARAPTDPEFVAIQERAIRDVVKLQEDAGLQVVTDGEFRRSSYWGRFVERCQGFVIKPAVFKFRDDHGHEVDFTATYANAKLKRTQPLATDEFDFLRTVTEGDGQDHHAGALHHAFLPLHRFCRRSPSMPMPETFFADLARIYREEIADLAKAGCRYVQLDEVAVAMLCDPAIRDKVASRRPGSRHSWSISTSRPSTTAFRARRRTC